MGHMLKMMGKTMAAVVVLWPFVTGSAAIAQITGQPTLNPLSPSSPNQPGSPQDGSLQDGSLQDGSLQDGALQSAPRQPLSQPTLGVQPAGNAFSNATYILGAGDQISLSVIGYPEFTGTVALLPDGTVTLPLIGPVRAAGLTPNQFSAFLTQQLSAYLVEPAVNVGLVVMRPIVVTVAGEVHRPGPLQLSGLTSNNGTTLNASNVSAPNTSAQLSSQPAIPTLSSAVLLAGGVTRDADIRQVIVRRPLPGGREELLTLNLWETITSSVGTADLTLRDGDSIFIPPLTGDGIDRRTVASSSLAPSTVRVKVVGEVVQPGEVAVPPNSSISSAVAIAGGPTADAQLSDVSLVRLTEDGQIQQSDIDISNLVDTYQVEDGDVIVVAKRGYLSVVDGIGRVLNPLNVFRLLGF
ncbi:MAG: polysaccharide biosynthesis/export family protein [Cyanobacteria bacterium J06627_32]